MKEKENITMSIYDTLNEQQREAVYQTEGPVLILAGAGSGKTRVLTHRTAYLIEERVSILTISWRSLLPTKRQERCGSELIKLSDLARRASGYRPSIQVV